MKKKKGFTLLELLVSIGIIALLSGLFFVNFRGFENKSALYNEVDKIASVLKQAQIYALVGQTIDNQRYNYGVHFEECNTNQCEYIFFKDSESEGNKEYESGEEVNTYSMVKNVEIDENKLLQEGVAVAYLDIVFKAPLGNVFVNGVTSTDVSTIILKNSGNDLETTITINGASGQIDYEN